MCPMRQLFVLAGFLSAIPPAFGQQDRILAPIDTRSSVVLKGNTSPKAQARYDQGLVAGSKKIAGMRLATKLSARQQADLTQLLAEQQSPSSPNYHNWLTPEQYADRFGISSNDMARITAWLESEGFSVDYTARARNYVTFSGTASQIQRTFQTQIHEYRIGTETHFANSTDPSIPAALEPFILAIQGLHDFRPSPQVATVAPDYNNASGHSLSPGDIATIYNINPLYQQGYNGSGLNLVVAGQTQIHIADIQAFRSEFGLPFNNPSLMVVPGSTDPGVTGDLIEATLDLEYSGGAAPNANVIFVYSSDVWSSAQYAIDQNLAPVMSSSYGGCEMEVSSDGSFAASLRQAAQQANAQGMTWVSSSGDDGSASCDYGASVTVAKDGLSANWPSTIPEITSVGGSEFVEGSGNYWSSTNASNGSSALSYIPEMAWNDTALSLANKGGLASGGGGASILYPKPAWQTGPGVPNDGARDVPDVSFAAADYHDGYIVYVNGANTFGNGGTSISTPIFAGVLTVMNQYLVATKAETKAGLGNINPQLYSLAQTPSNAIFHDITLGNNIVPCKIGTPTCTTGSIGYNAGPGYDQATGLGSANVFNMATKWAGQTASSATISLSANPPSITLSGSTALTATVKATSGSASPTGSVSFVWGLTSLGTVTLSASGNATVTVSGSTFGQAGNEQIVAYYSGDANFNAVNASLTLTVGAASSGSSAVVPSVTPNPVYQQTADAQGYAWFFTVRLTETAGVATTVTSFTFAGQTLDVATFFGSTSLPAHGTISANVRATVKNPPQNIVLGFAGTDPSGTQWTQQISVPFLPTQISAAMSLASAPATVAETPNGVEGCSAPYQYFYQQLDLQELNGVEVVLTRFLAGGNDYTQYIGDWFGSWRLAPFGSLLAGICWQLNSFPTTFNYELDGTDTSGNNIVVTATAGFEGPVANAGALTTSADSVSLTPGSSGNARSSLSVRVPSGQAWTATVFPANPRTQWLQIYPLSGTGPGALTVSAGSSGLSPGVYEANLVIQSINTLPQLLTIPVTFTVGGSQSVIIGGVTNNFSNVKPAPGFLPEVAPGMLAAVYGSNLAKGAPLTASLPLPYSLGGTSAAVNGIPAPLYYVSSGQLDIQIPYEVPEGYALLTVNNNGAVASFDIYVDETFPGIANTLPSGARGGSIAVYMTGEGDVTPFLATGANPTAAPLPQPRLPVSVTIGGVNAPVQFVGIPTWSVGVTQINVQVPSNIPAGVQPLVVTVAGTDGNVVAPAVNVSVN